MIQTGKFQKFPIVLMGVDYHKALNEHFQRLIKEKTIDPADVQLFLITDSVEEAVDHIRKYAIEGFGLKKRKKMKRWWLLGEKN
jgi:predicted Rossmann-fold nucleotide-binding protein